MSKIKYGSASHCALKYAKMKNRPVGMEDLMECFPTKFDKPSRVKETMSILTKYGLMSQVNDKWRITRNGVNYLLAISSTYRGANG